MITSYPGTTGSIWQCAHCGAWVEGGQLHSCPNPYAQYSPQSPDVLERIAKALEVIAEQLMRLRK